MSRGPWLRGRESVIPDAPEPICRPAPRPRKVVINGKEWACYEANALLDFVGGIEADRYTRGKEW